MRLPLGDRLTAERRWLLLGLALVIAPHLLRLPAWVVGVCAAALGWRLGHELGRWPLPGRLLRLALTLGTVGGVFATFHTIVGRDAGVALLLGLMCLKTLEMRSRRDTSFVIFLAFFVVVTGFLFGQSLLIGVYMFGVVWVLLAALIANEHGEAQAGDRVYARRAGLLLGQALPLLALLFVLFPRVDNPLWGMPKDASAGRTGLSEEMAPGEMGLLADSPEVAFRVQFDEPPPPAAQRYWRGPVLGAYDGRLWTPLKGIREQAAPPRGHGGGHVSYTVTLEPHQRHWWFALELPATIPDGAELNGEYQLLGEDPVRAVTRYRVESRLGGQTGPVPEPALEAYLRLPAHSAPHTRELMAAWRRETGSARDLIRRALAHFAGEGFYYTREPPLLPGDPVDDFLFQSRRGYCEHYASSFVVMMRAAGIPARVVTGYLGGEINPLGGYLIVRQSDAHAWAEVWLPDGGWVRVDPTAAIPPERILDAGDATLRLPDAERRAVGDGRWVQKLWSHVRFGWDRINHGWNQWIVGFDADRQKGMLERLGLDGIGWPALAGMLFGGLALVLLAIGARLVRREAGRRDPTQACYLKFCRRLARLGLVRGAAEGPADFARRVAAQRPELATAMWEVTRLYVSERYGPAPSRDRGRALCRAVRRPLRFGIRR